MTIVAERLLLVLERAVLERRWLAGLAAFQEEVGLLKGVRWITKDAELVGISLSSPRDAEELGNLLQRLGFNALQPASTRPIAGDYVIIDQDLGPALVTEGSIRPGVCCPWLSWRHEIEGHTTISFEGLETSPLVFPYHSWRPSRSRALSRQRDEYAGGDSLVSENDVERWLRSEAVQLISLSGSDPFIHRIVTALVGAGARDIRSHQSEVINCVVDQYEARVEIKRVIPVGAILSATVRLSLGVPFAFISEWTHRWRFNWGVDHDSDCVFIEYTHQLTADQSLERSFRLFLHVLTERAAEAASVLGECESLQAAADWETEEERRLSIDLDGQEWGRRELRTPARGGGPPLSVEAKGATDIS